MPEDRDVKQNGIYLTGYSEEEEVREELDYQSLDMLKKMHNKWPFRKVNLRAFSVLPSLQGLIALALPKKKLEVGSIGDMTLVDFREGVSLCSRKEHTGFLKNLAEAPVDFFDPDVSSYLRDQKGRICGLCLSHYYEPKSALVVELFFYVGEEGIRGLATMARYSLKEAVKKYPSGTVLILPNDKTHDPLLKKIFGDK